MNSVFYTILSKIHFSRELMSCKFHNKTHTNSYESCCKYFLKNNFLNNYFYYLGCWNLLLALSIIFFFYCWALLNYPLDYLSCQKKSWSITNLSISTVTNEYDRHNFFYFLVTLELCYESKIFIDFFQCYTFKYLSHRFK